MEQKYNKYLEKLNEYIQLGGKYQIGQDIMLVDSDISGIVMGFQRPNIYSIRLVGMNYNINKLDRDITTNTNKKITTIPIIDGEFNFNFPVLHSYTYNLSKLNPFQPNFNNYILANISGVPSKQFLNLVNNNVFLFEYIVQFYKLILDTSVSIEVNYQNKELIYKSKPLSLAAKEYKPQKKLSALAVEFNPANLFNADDVGEIEMVGQPAPVPAPLSSVDSAIQEAVLQSEREERQRDIRLKEALQKVTAMEKL